MFIRDEVKMASRVGGVKRGILLSCQVVFLSPAGKNLVLEELRARRLAVIKEENC